MGNSERTGALLAERFRTFWDWLGRNKDALAITFAVVAGGTTLYQYLASVDDARRKETLKYVDKSQDVRVAPARGAIAEVLLEKNKRAEYDSAWKKAVAAGGTTDDLEEFVARHKLMPHIITLVEFYMNVAGCVKARVCERQLACDFFMADISALNNSFRPLFHRAWRNGDGTTYMDMPLEFLRSCAGK